MIRIKNSSQIKMMIQAGHIVGEALAEVREYVKPGVSTKYIDTKVREYIEKCGAVPSFLGYGGFAGSACVSINEEVIHGIPSEKRILCEGDIVKIDVGAFYRGFHGDSAKTFAVGEISDEAKNLIAVTERCFLLAYEKAKVGARIGDLGYAVQSYAEGLGYGVVRKFVGHGIGENLHEEPDVPNYGKEGRGQRLFSGMTIAVEPMINVGTHEVVVKPDGWTVVTADGKLSAHYEHTMAICDDGVILTTDVEGII